MLSQELRPATFDEMAGQEENKKILKAVIKNPDKAPKCLIFAGAFGSGKCVVGNTRVSTSRGYLRIKDLVNVLGKGREVDDEGFIDISDLNVLVRGNHRASHLYLGGVKDTIKISSKRFELEGTPNHRVLAMTDTGMDWVYLSDIKVGDNVCISIEENILFNNKSWNVPGMVNTSEFDKGYFIGSILGDGSVTDTYVSFMGNLNSCKYISGMFSDSVRVKEFKDERREDLYSIRLYNKDLVTWMKMRNLGGDSEKRVTPEWIFGTNRDFLRGYLSGLYDTEGSRSDIDIQTISKSLMKGFKAILELFGISSTCAYRRLSDKLYVNGNQKNHIAYRVQVNSLSDMKKFMSIVELRCDDKRDNINRLINSMGDTSVINNSRDLLPNTEYVKSKIRDLYGDIKAVYLANNRVGFKDFCNKDKRFSIKKNLGQPYSTKDSFNELSNVYEEICGESYVSELNGIFKSYKFVKVESVETGREEVFDLTVEDSHAFMANGLINHNTTSARIMARALNNIKDRDFDLLSSPFYYEFDSTVIGNVETIRNLRDQFLVSYGDYYRIIVFDETHAISNAAQNALLKVLEEAVGKVFFIMCTTEPNKLLPTIRSRSLELEFTTVPKEEIVSNLSIVSEQRNINLPDEIKLIIADRSAGHMRNAHMLLDKYLLLGDEDFKDSVRSSITLFCKYLVACYLNDKDSVLKYINELMNIPKDDLQSDWNTVLTESMRGYVGFEIRHQDIKSLVNAYKSDFNVVVNCYFSPWIKNAFIDMCYFQATFLNMYLVISQTIQGRKSTESAVASTQQTTQVNNRVLVR